MSLGDRIRTLGFRTMAIATARALGAVFLVGLYLLTPVQTPSERVSVAVAVGFWIAASLLFGAAVLASRRVSVETLLGGFVLSDAVTLGLLTAVLGARFDDPFYVWYLAEAVFVATVFRDRRAWMLGAVLATSYVVSRAVAAPATTVPQLLFFVGDALVIIAAAWFVWFTGGRQIERGEHLEAQQIEMLALNRRLERSVSELRALAEFTEVIHSTLDIEAIGPVALDIVQRVTDIPAACLFVIDQKKQETLIAASNGLPLGSATVLADAALGKEASASAGEAAFSCIDLVEHEGMLVVFGADATTIEALSEDHRVLLQAIASQLLVAVENARLYKLTKRLAITDEVTGLHNYRFLQQRLDEEIGRAKRYDKRVSFLMLDVDDFKRINDVYGHRVGDVVLAEIGQVLRSTVREVDVVARYGGEEFSVVLPETDVSGAFIVAEKIREAVSSHRFPDADGNRRIHATVSVGLASFPTHAHDKETLLRAADDALYNAKSAGKDRVRAPRLRLRRAVPDDAPLEEVAE